MADVGTAARDVADPASILAHQVPRLVGTVAADRRRLAVTADPAARHTARQVGASYRCIVTPPYRPHTAFYLFSVLSV